MEKKRTGYVPKYTASSVEHREESLMVCMVIIDDMTADKSSRMNIWHHFLMTSCLETHRATAAAR